MLRSWKQITTLKGWILMDKNKIWLDLYIGRKIKWDVFSQYFKANGSDTTWYIHYPDDSGVANGNCQLHIHLIDDSVKEASLFKADVYGGHGRPTIIEKAPTAAEKKYAAEIFDACIKQLSHVEIDSAIENAISLAANYNDYTIIARTADAISYVKPDGKKGKLKIQKLIQALTYSHQNLRMLREADFVAEFVRCFGKGDYEPIFAILQNIDPSNYPEYPQLEYSYRLSKLHEAVNAGDIIQCKNYIDVLCDTKTDIVPLVDVASRSNNATLVQWIIDNSQGNPSNLSRCLSETVDNTEIFDQILNSGRCALEPSVLDTFGMNKIRENTEAVIKLLRYGYYLPATQGWRIYERLSLDEIKEFLQFNIKLDAGTFERILQEKRWDILEIVSREKDKYVYSNIALNAFIRFGMFSKFVNALEQGYEYETIETFDLCFSQGKEWIEQLLKYPFNINLCNGRLLHAACENLDAEKAIFLLENGANPSIKSQYSENIFEKAAGFHGHLSDEQALQQEKLCKYLFEYGLDPIQDAQRTPTPTCYMMGFSKEFVRYFIDWLVEHDRLNSPDILTKPGNLPIFYVCSSFNKGDLDLLRYMLQKGAVANADGITDDKLLCEASSKDRGFEYVKCLLDAGANIDEIDIFGRSALYIAALCGSLDTCQLLIERGANVNATPVKVTARNYATPSRRVSILDAAVEHGHLEIAELLRKHGAKTASELV